MNHDDVLTIAAGQPIRQAPPGEILIEEGEPTGGVFILRTGTLEVRRNGQLVAVVTEPGSLVGEMSMLLESPSTADVVARDTVEVHDVGEPERFFADHPELSFFLARILAQRLNAVTGYLSSLKERYGDADNHLGLAAAVVDQLLASRGSAIDWDPSDDEIVAAARLEEQA